MKAISAIIVVVLLLLISISLISVVYVWSSALTGTVTSTTEETTSELTKQLSGCLKIDAISKNQIYLRNCGKGVITNNSLSVFIDDVKVGHSVEEIGEDQTGTVNISGLWQFSMDRHNLKLTNGAAFVQALIELEPNKDGLVGYWSFDEGSGNKVYDKSGNGNDGSLLPSGSGPIWTAGKSGSALQFDGTDDYVDTGGNLNIANDFTIAVWVYQSSPDHGTLIDTDMQFKVSTNGLLIAQWYDGGWQVRTSSNSINYNSWNYVLLTFDGTRIHFYINGELDTNTYTVSANTRSGSDIIGRDGVSGSELFTGIIDKFSIYNRALTPDQTVVMKMV